MILEPIGALTDLTKALEISRPDLTRALAVVQGWQPLVGDAQHRFDGRPGRWRAQLSPSLREAIETKHADWLSRHGYCSMQLFCPTAYVVHGEATCSHVDELEIVTQKDRWSYAVGVPRLDALVGTGRVVTRLFARVEKGEVGLGLLSPDRKSFVHEVFLGASDAEKQVDLFASPADFVELMIRNTSVDGPSKVRIRVGPSWRLADIPEPINALFAPRIPSKTIVSAVDIAARRFPERETVVLADTPQACAADPRVAHLDCSIFGPECLTPTKIARALFVYACEYDDVGGPFIRAIAAQGGVFLPANVSRPSTSFYHHDAVARRVLERQYLLQQQEGFAKWDTPDFVNILQLIARTQGLAGAYVELGCYRGSSGAVALDYMAERKLRRSCWFFDVFDGFNYPAMQSSPDQTWAGTHATEGEALVRARLERWQAEDGPRVHVVRSDIIADDLPAEVGPVVLANIDVDLFEAVAAGLRKIAPLIVVGGAMIVEDPGHTPWLVGARAALDGFLESTIALDFTALHMESGQTVLVRHA